MNIRLKDTIVNLANIATIQVDTEHEQVSLQNVNGGLVVLPGPEAVWFFNTPGVLPILSLEEAYADREKIEANAAKIIAERHRNDPPPAEPPSDDNALGLSSIEAQMAQIDAALEAAKSESSLDPDIIKRARARRDNLQAIVDKRKAQKVTQ